MLFRLDVYKLKTFQGPFSVGQKENILFVIKNIYFCKHTVFDVHTQGDSIMSESNNGSCIPLLILICYVKAEQVILD